MNTENSTGDRSNRRGSIIVLSAAMLVVIFAFAAFTVDVGLIALTKTEMQTAADAAALAACAELVDPLVDGRQATDPKLLLALLKSRAAAVEVASKNPNGFDSGTTLNALTDIQIGNRTWNVTTQTWDLQWNQWPFNAVEVTARRSSTAGNGLPLSFAPVIGHSTADLAESTIVAVSPATGINSPGCVPAPILPIALDLDTWVDVETNGGPDDLTWSESTQSVVEIPDGIPEIVIFPNGLDGSLPSGNRGTVNIGGHSNSTAELVDQIRNGVDCHDLAPHGGKLDFSNGPILVSGDPGISNAIKTPLEEIIGQKRVIFLFTSVSGTGATSTYTLVRMVGVRVMSVAMRGALSNRGLIVQPVAFSLPTGIPGDAPTTTYGTLYSPPRIVQ